MQRLSKSAPAGEPFLIWDESSPRFQEFSRQFAALMVKRYGKFAQIFSTKTEMEFIIPPRPAAAIHLDGGNGEYKVWQFQVEEYAKDLSRYPIVKAQFFNEIMTHLSSPSENRVRAHKDFDGLDQEDPIKLWAIVRSTHEGLDGGQAQSILMIKTQLASLRMGKQSMADHTRSFLEIFNRLQFLEDKTTTAKSAMHEFNRSIDMSPHRDYLFSYLQLPVAAAPREDVYGLIALMTAYDLNLRQREAEEKPLGRGQASNNAMSAEVTSRSCTGSDRGRGGRSGRGAKTGRGGRGGRAANKPKKDGAGASSGCVPDKGCILHGPGANHLTKDCFKLQKIMCGETTASAAVYDPPDHEQFGFKSEWFCGLSGDSRETRTILDTGANRHVFASTPLVVELLVVPPSSLQGVAGDPIIINQLGTSIFGSGLYSPTSKINLISLGQMVEDGFQLKVDETGRKMVLIKGRLSFQFKMGDTMLYDWHGCLFEGSQITKERALEVLPARGGHNAFTRIATPTLEIYNKGQIARAKAVREICAKMNHPGTSALCKLLDNNSFGRMQLSGKDVRAAKDIWGVCPGCFNGKSVFTNTLQIKQPDATRIGELVHLDYFFMPGPSKATWACMIAVDNFTGYISVHTQKQRTRKLTELNLLDLFKHYGSRSHRITCISTDSEKVFSSNKGAVEQMGAQLKMVTPYRHESIAERNIATIKGKFRSTLCGLPFNLPKRLYMKLLVDVVCTINMSPNTSRDSCITPLQQFDGQRIDYELAAREQFGQNVLVHNPTPNRPDLDPRGQTGIVVGRNTHNGSCEVWTITGQQYVVRDILHPRPMDEVTVAWINDRATEDNRSYSDARPLQTFKEHLMDSASPAGDEDEGDEGDIVDTQHADADDEEELRTFSREILADPPAQIQAPDLLPPVPEAQVQLTPDPEDLTQQVEGAVQEAPAPVQTTAQVPTGGHRYNTRGNPTALASAHLTVKQATSIDDEATADGIAKEIRSLINKGVLRFVRASSVTNEELRLAIPSKIFMKQKGDIMKARMVAGGHRQPLMAAEDTASPTVMTATVMGMIQIITSNNMTVCVADVETAYLNADNENAELMFISRAETQHFLAQSPDLNSYVDSSGRLLCRVVKALYGLQQSARLWYEHLRGSLEKLQYRPTKEDRCAFVCNQKGKVSTILAHVDDLLICTHSIVEMNRVKEALEGFYPRMKFDQSDNFTYLGMEIQRQGPSRSTTMVSLQKFTKSIIEENKVTRTRTAPTNRQFTAAVEDLPIDITSYLSLLMKLMYLAKRTRPDILLACSFLASHNHEPKKAHWDRLIHLVEYLNGTPELGLLFKREKLELCCQADASYLAHSGAKSHSGITYSLAARGPSIMAFSTKQKLVGQSSTEAELIALHEGARTTVWMCSLFKQLGAKLDTPTVYQDNEATIRLAKLGGPASNSTKHIQMRFFTVSEYIRDKLLTVVHRRTEDMVGDILTKPLCGPLFLKLRALLLNM
jgi:hypothetical protein